MSAAHYGLDNLVVIIDRNTLQITGRTEKVSQLEPLVEKFKAFGYALHEVNGHNLAELLALFEQIPFEEGKPSLILAHTIKGKGVSFIEDQVNWHHHLPTNDEFAIAMAELESAEKTWHVQYGNR